VDLPPRPLRRAAPEQVARVPLPRIIHQTWKDARVPARWLPLQRSWQRHHPGWEYRFWTDADLRSLVARDYPWFLVTYDGYREPIKRVDAARYLLMHRFGGLYVDLDFEAFRPIDPLLAEHDVVLVPEPPEHLQLAIVRASGLHELVCNAFLASRPQHAFWGHVLERLVPSSALPGPLDATGPFFLTRALQSFPERSRVTMAPWEQLCPVTSHQADGGALADPAQRARVASSAYAAHHWSGSWFRNPDTGAAKWRLDVVNVTRYFAGKPVSTQPVALAFTPDRDAGPLVSCLMVTRGRVALAARAIRCFLAQTYENRELVIVDDAEDDALAAHVAGLGDPRVRHIRVSPGEPLGALRNLSIEHARGSYVCQWDDDDLYHPRRVELQLAMLQATGDAACFLADNHIWWPQRHRLARSVRRIWECSMLCAKSSLIPYPRVRRGEDTPVVQAVLQRGGAAVLEEVPHLYVYVVHGENTFPAAHFDEHWAQAPARYEGADYEARLQSLLAPLPHGDQA
jgi:mannosyltransferase OCH1-like enzyme